MDSWLEISPAEDWEFQQSHFESLRRGEIESYQIEKRYIKKNGEIILTNLTKTLIRDKKGNVSHVIGMVEDITERKRAEIALRRSEERFGLATRAARVGVWEWDLQSGDFYLDPAVKALLGYADDEIPNDLNIWTTYIHPDDLQPVMAAAQAHLNGETSEYVFEHRMLHKDGSIRWILVRGIAIRDAEGNALRFVGTDTDITERKQAEIALQESKRRYEALIASAPIGVFRCDSPLNCIYVNDRWCEMTGRPKESALGEGWIEALHPDERYRLAGWVEMFDRITPDDFVLPPAEGRFLRPNGSVCWYYIQVALEFDAEGKAIGHVGTLTDITERKQREAELLESRESLRQSEEQLRLTIENTPVGIATCDLESRFLSVNQAVCRIFGYSSAELLQMNILVLTHPNSLEISWSSIAQLQSGVIESYQIEKQYIHKSGRPIDAICNIVLVKDRNGIPLYFVKVIEDITEKKQAENSLRQQAKRDRLLNSISQRVRASLDLQEILDMTCAEILQVLRADRVIVYCLFSDGTGLLDIAESASPSCSTGFNFAYPEAAFLPEMHERYRQGNVYTINDRDDGTVPPDLGEFLKAIEVRAKLAVPILEGDRLWGLLVAHQCDRPRYWQIWDIDLLQQIANQLTMAVQQVNLYEQSQQEIRVRRQAQLEIQQRSDREHLLKNIVNNMRSSLNLNEILNITVAEIHQLLQADRVLVYSLFPNGTGATIAESVNPSFRKVLDNTYPAEVFSQESHEQYSQGRVCALSDRDNGTVSPCLVEFLAEMQVRAKLVVPIIGNRGLWGLLIAHQCERPRRWQGWEIDLMEQLAAQLAIAIYQSELYHQAQHEIFVRQQLQQELQKQAASDRLLSEITLSINQSSSVDEVLSENLEKVRQFLAADRVAIFQFNTPSEGVIAKEAVCRLELSILDTAIEDTCFLTTERIESYIHGQVTRIEDSLADNISTCYRDLLIRMHVRANLIVPIAYGNQLWGLLIVHQCDTPRIWEPDEIQFVKQIVVRICIAVQKERLYLQITRDLNQKKILLKEIHHRVKNNLQIMSSLLYMQFRHTSSEVKALSDEYQTRIQSMALIHDQLYRSEGFASIDFHEYATNLTDNLLQCYGTNPYLIQINLDINNIYFSLDQAIPIGLIIRLVGK